MLIAVLAEWTQAVEDSTGRRKDGPYRFRHRGYLSMLLQRVT
jgi:hypothetical protein